MFKNNFEGIANVRLIISDIDGVLRNSSMAISNATKNAFLSNGLDYKFKAEDEWHARGIGRYNKNSMLLGLLLACNRSGMDLGKIIMSDDPEKIMNKVVESNIEKNDEELIARLLVDYKKNFNSKESQKKIMIYKGVKESIDFLFNRNYKVALFTAANRVTVERDLGFLGIERFFEILCEEDVKNGKPSGEGIVKIMKDCATQPNETLYIGDAVVDVMAGRDAGCITSSVLCGMGMRQNLEKAAPDMIFDDFSSAVSIIAGEKK